MPCPGPPPPKSTATDPPPTESTRYPRKLLLNWQARITEHPIRNGVLKGAIREPAFNQYGRTGSPHCFDPVVNMSADLP